MDKNDLLWLLLLQHQLIAVRNEVSVIGQVEIAIKMVHDKIEQVKSA